MNSTNSLTAITTINRSSSAKGASCARLLIATGALVGAIALSSSSALAQGTGAGDRGAAIAADGKPVDVVKEFLANTAPDRVDAAARRLVAEDATYVSPNFDNPELKKIEPWTGTGRGPQAFSSTFIRVAKYWKVDGKSRTSSSWKTPTLPPRRSGKAATGSSRRIRPYPPIRWASESKVVARVWMHSCHSHGK